jgi:hypothetical protein
LSHGNPPKKLKPQKDEECGREQRKKQKKKMISPSKAKFSEVPSKW